MSLLSQTFYSRRLKSSIALARKSARSYRVKRTLCEVAQTSIAELEARDSTIDKFHRGDNYRVQATFSLLGKHDTICITRLVCRETARGHLNRGGCPPIFRHQRSLAWGNSQGTKVKAAQANVSFLCSGQLTVTQNFKSYQSVARSSKRLPTRTI